MLTVKNMAAYMVNIPPRTHIKPLATAEVDETNRAVALLIKRGVLVDATSEAAAKEPSFEEAVAKPEAAADDGADSDPGEPTKVADIKAELDALGITYADTAKKAELLDLLRKAKA